MSATATKDPLAKMGAPLPPAITATFAGDYYKSSGKGGKEYLPFEVTYKVPLSVVAHEDLTPEAFFMRYKEENLMKKLGGGAGRRTVYLTKVEGELPKGLSYEHRLNWVADYDSLAELAREVGTKKYIKVDLKNDTKTQETISINVHVYPTSEKLRDAIKRILNEPEAFANEQKKLEERDAAAPKNMEADIAALAD